MISIIVMMRYCLQQGNRKRQNLQYDLQNFTIFRGGKLVALLNHLYFHLSAANEFHLTNEIRQNSMGIGIPMTFKARLIVSGVTQNDSSQNKSSVTKKAKFLFEHLTVLLRVML